MQERLHILCLLRRSEETITRVPEAGNDHPLVRDLLVDRAHANAHIGMRIAELLDAGPRSKDSDYMNLRDSPLNTTNE